jgi:deazaflavin-dependent oxidoreductase (nitroreductase family)
VLLLTTIGRKTGLPRTTPLQYEIVDDVIYVASARGQKADWFRNVVADPHVRVQIKDRQFEALAEPITDPARIADFLELRLRRHPRMLRLMLLAEGLPLKFGRAELERFAAGKALVALRRTERS